MTAKHERTDDVMPDISPSEETARLLSIAKVVEITGLSRGTIYTQLRVGAIRSIKVGHRRLVPYSALLDWIDLGLNEEWCG